MDNLFIKKLIENYFKNFLYQIPKLILSADILGNPVKLAENIKAGVK
jgi:hypothetical protein